MTAEIREALEDAEVFRILEESKRRNAGKPTYTLEQVKRRLGIVTRPRHRPPLRKDRDGR